MPPISAVASLHAVPTPARPQFILLELHGVQEQDERQSDCRQYLEQGTFCFCTEGQQIDSALADQYLEPKKQEHKR
jgi:hypothetical protein